MFEHNDCNLPAGSPNKSGGRFGKKGQCGPTGAKAAGTETAGAGPVPKILQGVDSKANAAAQIEMFRSKRKELGLPLSPALEKAAEEELRALPLIHGTTVAGAVGAATEGLRSYAEMQKDAARFLEEADELRAEINDVMDDPDPNQDWSNYTAEDIESALGVEYREAAQIAGMIQELKDIERVLEGATYPADRKQGLDGFVFMSHGQKHPDYGNVAVVIDNAVLQDGWATEKDIVMVPDDAAHMGSEDDYSENRVRRYKDSIVQGDDFYAVAAAKFGSPQAVNSQSRAQLFEIKAPRVPKSAVLGFMVEGDLDVAQRLAEKRGIGTGKVLYVDEMYGSAAKLVRELLKTLQRTGRWDEGAIDAFREDHEGVILL